MSAMATALNEIQHRIHPELLKMAFDFKDMFGYRSVSQSSLIRSNVIQCRVATLMNLTGGSQMRIHSDEATRVIWDDYISVYEFDSSIFKGLQLISAMDFQEGTYRRTTYGVTPNCSRGCHITHTGESGNFNGNIWSGAEKQAQRLYDTTNQRAPRGSGKVRVVGDNLIAVEDVTVNPIGTFTVLVGHDPDMLRLEPKQWLEFADLCVLAVKAYIYNNLYISQKENAIVKGRQISAYSSVIERYSDAEERFSVAIREWGRVAFEADPVRLTEFIESQILPEDL